MVEENVANKLRFIPKEELSRLIRKSIPKRSILQARIVAVFGIKTEDPISFIDRLSRDRLIQFCTSSSEISENNIQQLYAEYVDTKHPAFFLSQIKNIEWPTFEEFKTSIHPAFEEKINQEFNTGDNPSYQNFKLNEIFFENKVIELRFSYEKRIDYIDPATEDPTFTFGLEHGFIWLSPEQNSAITKVDEYEIHHLSRKVFPQIFDCNFRTFSLDKRIVDEIFGINSLKRGHYHHPRPTEDDVQNKSIGDQHLMTKPEGVDTNQRYMRSSSYHRVIDLFGHGEIPVAINSNLGKMAILADIKKTVLIESIHELHQKILDFMEQFRINDPLAYLQNFHADEIYSLDFIPSQKGKKIFIDLFKGISVLKKEGAPEIPVGYSGEQLLRSLKSVLIPSFSPSCDSCGTTTFYCSECNNSNFSYKFDKGKIHLFCNECNIIIENNMISDRIACEHGHPLSGSIENFTLFIFTKKSLEEVRALQIETDISFDFNIEDTIIIENGNLKILPASYKERYLFTELPAFRQVPEIQVISSNVRSTQLDLIRGTKGKIIHNPIGEKCPNYSQEHCTECLIRKHGNCIQRVIASMTNGEVHAHSPVEFGDLSFQQVIDGELVRIVCLVKAYLPKQKELTINKDDRLLAQVHIALSDDLIQFLGIISATPLNKKLEEEIVRLTRYKSKRVVFFDQTDLVRIFSIFDWNS